ncbi:hypothetical protein [Pleionea sp. CnH1-48]|uniref:hypothetical protein n=1 Tax=Pleionea sp. CnH1-48 TaxID=2954494 RepID=UPI00209745F5|nr:hypothetical protein [Pleionea sp. CnH1-48]MCO7227186.1 hypothetical protein [Pleionea sp. CnH1-48]
MYDLVEGIQHKDSGKVFRKHLKKLMLIIVGLVIVILFQLGFSDNEDGLQDVFVTAGALILLWCADLMRGLCELSDMEAAKSKKEE